MLNSVKYYILASIFLKSSFVPQSFTSSLKASYFLIFILKFQIGRTIFSQFCKRHKFKLRMHTAFYRRHLKSSFLISLVRTFIPENKITVELTYFLHNETSGLFSYKFLKNTSLNFYCWIY